MKKNIKVWAATFMAAVILGSGSITASAAPPVTPPADSEGYIFAGYEAKLASGVSEAELAKGRLARTTFYSAKGLRGQTDEYHYDSQGRLSESLTMYGDDTTPAYRTVYAYDAQGNLIKETKYFCRDNTVSREVTYDGRGNITKWVEYIDGKVWAQADYSFV